MIKRIVSIGILIVIIVGVTIALVNPISQEADTSAEVLDVECDEIGTVVFLNSDISVGQAVWDDFVERSSKGEAVSVLLVNHHTLGDPSSYSKEYYEEVKDDYPMEYTSELSFDESGYTITSLDEEESYVKNYPYMVYFEEVAPTPDATYEMHYMYILVHDESVTWQDIWKGMISSQAGNHVDHYPVYSDYIFKDK